MAAKAHISPLTFKQGWISSHLHSSCTQVGAKQGWEHC